MAVVVRDKLRYRTSIHLISFLGFSLHKGTFFSVMMKFIVAKKVSLQCFAEVIAMRPARYLK